METDRARELARRFRKIYRSPRPGAIRRWLRDLDVLTDDEMPMTVMVPLGLILRWTDVPDDVHDGVLHRLMALRSSQPVGVRQLLTQSIRSSLVSGDPDVLRRCLRDVDSLTDIEHAYVLAALFQWRCRTDASEDIRDGARYRLARFFAGTDLSVRRMAADYVTRDDLVLYAQGYPDPRPLSDEDRVRCDRLLLELTPGLKAALV